MSDRLTPPVKPDLGLYQTKYILRNLLRNIPGVGTLSPNALSLFALVPGLLAAWFLFQGQWLFALLSIMGRMIINTLDGLVAEEFNKKSSLGGYLNRLPGEFITLLLPDLAVAEAMFDKYRCHEALLAAGLPSPDTWVPEELPADAPLPLLVKRRWGYASRDIYRCETLDEVRFFVGYAGVPVIVQRFCPGEQFSIDVLCDLDGRAVNVIPRTMIESKGGESIKGQTIADERLIDLGRRVAEGLGLVGPATIQCFDEPEGLPVTDINCRFGGAFPLPLAAGSRYPELILRIACGERVEPHVGQFTPGITMTRFYDSVIIPAGAGAAQPGRVAIETE